jgi:hypothetical protein
MIFMFFIFLQVSLFSFIFDDDRNVSRGLGDEGPIAERSRLASPGAGKAESHEFLGT